MTGIIRIHPADNVGVTSRDVKAGRRDGEIVFRQDIPAGHKVALVGIPEGGLVRKYGFSIARANRPITAGEHVHSHNAATTLGSSNVSVREMAVPEISKFRGPVPTFQGFRRPDGRVAIRNEIWIINTVGCVNVPSQHIAEMAARRWVVPGSSIDGIHAFAHPYGCSQLGGDLDNTRKILASLVRHPNAAAVLILGLGCENNTLRSFLEEVGEFDPDRIRFFSAQDVGDEEEKGLEEVEKLVAYASGFQREALPASELVLGMKCGGSDGFSGLTANPLVGRIADRHTEWGGTVILTEVPEMFGAEQAIFPRCQDTATLESAVEMVNRFRDYFLRHNEPVSENPSPGNKDGGITTLEEKSLGCIQKGGMAPVRHIGRYGDSSPQKLGGLSLIEGPGNDGVSSTALAAAGAHVILFTTGRGTPLGVPVPTLKVSTNTDLARRKPKWIDFDAGTLLDPDGSDPAEDLMKLVLAVASGQPARNEINGFREIAIWKQGVTL
ncbi:MAG: altronate dehydratase family protein [Verrucomicrobia bacterium]|nr:altronate dehydratase family protein [Verrucomicrobiota bacterium]